MMRNKESFDSGAKQYDEARLSYPDDVINWIIERTCVSKDDILLEIGAGTGQATIPFAKRGFAIHCIELGKNLADFLIKKTDEYNVTVDICSFEDWNPPESFQCSFIFSATAFHWLDINIKYKKCHSLLSDGGYLVLLWNDFPDSNNPIIDEAYKRLFSFYSGKAKTSNNENDINDARRKEILESGVFELVDYLNYKWFTIEKREMFTKGFFSQSSFLSLNQEQQKSLSYEITELFAGLDDEMKTEVNTSIFIAKKINATNEH